MRKILGALLCALSSLTASATNFGTDASDLWWNQNESGWGVNVMQQYNTLFMTFFVYGSNNVPIWYVAPAVTSQGSSGSTFTYTGTLYQTAGPWFGGSFNPANVSSLAVGSVTFTLNTPTTATMTYSVNGVNVSKSLTRQTWTSENFTGMYVGGASGTLSGCSANGTSEEVDVFTITHSGTSFSLSATNQLSGATCTYTGSYSQAGHLGSVSGNYSCDGGASGPFTMQELDGTLSGFTLRVDLRSGSSCALSARMGGARRTN
jgi:hypothetical protein